MAQYADDNKGVIPPDPKALKPDWSEQTSGLAVLYPYAKTDRIFCCVKSKLPKSKDPKGYYKVYPAGATVSGPWYKASYDFWPQVYMFGANPGRFDVDMEDTSMNLYSWFSANSIAKAKDQGGPICSCLNHPLNIQGDEGVLSLNLKGGNVKFLAAGKYPWY